ncbi:unnamed protein product [Ambrosiozyma monospora]|uniref:Unnamed protein product n=1 Tax=Ambrosiozyma monospora TaxID=43982 RepID=A0ACB5SZJ9_AMBMO|nr:unnamed protein product [Ambrosiozyma monospora]
MSKQITFVTGNKNKLREVIAVLTNNTTNPNKDPTTAQETTAQIGKYTLTNQKLDLDELQGSINEVTIHKARQAAKIIGGPALVEDTCLAFNALNDLPGPYIKWFVDKVGLEGLNKMLVGFDDKSAKAITTFGYCESADEDAEVLLFQGITEGKIVKSRGPTDFGWDSIFEPKGFETTYAEMKGVEKNKISHRSKALAKLKTFLLENEK